MKKTIIEQIEIPEGVEINIEGNTINVKGIGVENKRTFRAPKINFEKKEKEIIIKSENATKKEKKILNTIKAHIKNMIKGVQEKFEYKLKICSSHFPIKVEIDNNKNEAIIKNFLGEKIPRKAKFPKNVDVKLERDVIVVSSHNKELAGQTAANFEQATRISMRDRRIFQDGIFITNKAGEEI